MDYSVFLGPNNRYIPDDKWDEYRASGKLHSYSLVFRRVARDGWYKATLTDGTVEFNLGQVLRAARRSKQWAVIPNPSYVDKTIVDGHQLAVKRYSQQGFATRLAGAEYLMRVQEFTDPLDW